MMFSSNQELRVSGSLSDIEYLKQSLDFGLTISGVKNCLLREHKPTFVVYQITEDGNFCVGHALKETKKEGWEFFPFDYDLDVLARIIKQHLEKQKNFEEFGGDGTTRKGFLMRQCPDLYSSEEEGIKNPWFGTLVFEPFSCYYAK